MTSEQLHIEVKKLRDGLKTNNHEAIKNQLKLVTAELGDLSYCLELNAYEWHAIAVAMHMYFREVR